MSIESDIYAKSIGGNYSGAGPTFSPETENLLQAALLQGGAVAQVAAELAHPNGSFLSMAKHKLGQSFSFVMDTLSIPSNAIAAMMDSDLTFEEARKQHVTPSDILFRDKEKPNTLGEKIGDFGARLVVDVLLDPLTYVTFGTSSGLVGVSKLAAIPLKGATARKLGLATTKIVDETGQVVEEAVRHRAVSKAGLAELQKITTHIEDTLKRDTLDTFYSDTNIRARLNRVVDKLRGKSPEQITDFMSKAPSAADRAIGAEYIVAEKLRDIYKMSDTDLSKLARPGDLADTGLQPFLAAERADQLRFAEQLAVKQAMDEQAERLVRHTVAAKRAEIEAAAKSRMSQLIEDNVEKGGILLDKFGRPMVDQQGNRMIRDLAREWIDKGGIKAFGYSVLSGAKIRAALSLLPGLSHVDRFSQPIRALMGSLFSTNWTASGRVPDTLLQIRQRAKNISDVKQTEIFSFIPRLYDKLGITEEEDRLISQAIATDMPPAASADQRLETLWTLLRSHHGNQMSQEMADGKYGDDIVRMWRAATALKDQLKKNLITMHESGIAAFPQKNYIPGVLNEQRRIQNPFVKFKTSKAVNAEKAELVKWRNVEKPEEVLYGTEESLQLERLSKAEERQRIEKEIAEAVMNNEQRKAKLTSEIETLWSRVAKSQVNAIMRGSDSVLKTFKAAGDDAFNINALERVVREAVPKIDRDRILKEYVAKYYQDGAKLKSAPDIFTAEDVAQLKTDLAMGDEDLDTMGEYIASHLDDFGIKVSKAPTPGSETKKVTDDYQKKLKELMAVIMEAGIEGKKRYLNDALSTTDFTKVISGLSEEWHKDPGGISRVMEAILGKEFQLSTIMEDLSDVKNGLEMELKGPGLKRVDGRWFYKDKKDKIFERVRATAKEINDNYFNGEEMFTESALKATLVGSLNAVRAATSRDLLDDVAKRFGVPVDAAPSDFVQLGIAGMTKEAIDLQKFMQLQDGKLAIKNAEGKELYFHPTVAQAVNDMLKVLSEDPASNFLAQRYDQLTNIWKASVTSIFPSFHGRNAISNVFQHMMDIGFNSLNPTNHIIASRLIQYGSQIEKLGLRIAEGDSNATRELIDLQKRVLVTDKRGHEWTVGEIVQVAKNNVIAFNPNIIGQTDVMYSGREMVDALQDDLFPKYNKYGTAIAKGINPFSQRFMPFRVGRKVGNYVEWQARLVDFIANLKHTGDVEHAAYQTKQFLFDYQNLTPFERNVMRRLIPFYTYSRKNLEMQVETLLTKPGRIGTLVHGFQSIGDVWGMGALSDEEREMLPNWMRDSLNVVVKREGDKLTMLTTLGTPFEQPFQQYHNLLGSLNPLIKGPLEVKTNFQFFSGKALSEVTNATGFIHAPKALQDFIGFTENTYTGKDGEEHTLYVSLKPQNMNLFNNLPFTPRILSMLKLMETKDVPTQYKYLSMILGMKPDQVDLTQESANRDKEMYQQLVKILDDAGVGYEFSRFQLNQ